MPHVKRNLDPEGEIWNLAWIFIDFLNIYFLFFIIISYFNQQLRPA